MAIKCTSSTHDCTVSENFADLHYMEWKATGEASDIGRPRLA